ncbi:MAG: hypothetical protein RJA22_995 [Verrucomicrobiota bacterium]|jgi:hypothetical protein
MPRRPNPKPRHRPGLLLAGLACLGLLPHLQADTQILLRNGDRLSGRILREDTNGFTLTNSLLGLVSLPHSAVVERRESPATPAPPAPDPGTEQDAARRKLEQARAAFVTGQLSATEYHRLLARAASTTARPESPGPLSPGHPTLRLSGEVQAGLDLALATKDRQLYSGRVKLQHGWRQLRNTADYLFTYGRADGELNANRMDGTIKSDHDLTERLYVYNQANGGYDEVRQLDNYWQLGPGAGWRAVRSPAVAVQLEAGINFQEQHWGDGTSTDVFYYRLGQQARWALTDRLTLDQKLEFFPEWDDPTEFKLRAEGNLRLWLYGNLSLNLTVIDFYDTMTARGVEPNDLQVRSTLGVTF